MAARSSQERCGVSRDFRVCLDEQSSCSPKIARFGPVWKVVRFGKRSLGAHPKRFRALGRVMRFGAVVYCREGLKARTQGLA